MPYDPGLAQLFRDDLATLPFTEKKMFGGLCFLVHGHMVGGVHKGGAMVRVGKPNESAALAIPGTGTMDFTGRPMPGMVSASDDLMADDTRRRALLALATGHVATLPPK